jgi:hypothetical protein
VLISWSPLIYTGSRWVAVWMYMLLLSIKPLFHSTLIPHQCYSHRRSTITAQKHDNII